jgi:phosphatidylglycerophosphate synthase
MIVIIVVGYDKIKEGKIIPSIFKIPLIKYHYFHTKEANLHIFVVNKSQQKKYIKIINQLKTKYHINEKIIFSENKQEGIEIARKYLKETKITSDTLFLIEERCILLPEQYNIIKQYSKNKNTIIIEGKNGEKLGFYTKEMEKFINSHNTRIDKHIKGYSLKDENKSEIERIIKSSLRKDGDSFVSKYLNRPLSIFVSTKIARFDFLTPNTLTIIIFISSLISSLLFIKGHIFLGAIFLHLSSVIDGCDGEIARLKNQSSKFGALLDATLDRYSDIINIFSIAFYFPKSTLNFIAYSLAITGTILISYTSHLGGKRARFITRDIRLFIIFIGGILSIFWIKSIIFSILTVGILSHIGSIYSLYYSPLKKQK